MGSKMDITRSGQAFGLMREATLYFGTLWTVKNKVEKMSPGIHFGSHSHGVVKSSRLRRDQLGQTSGFFNIWVLSKILLGNMTLGRAGK